VMDSIKAMINQNIQNDIGSFNLSNREIEILALIGEGLNNKEIGQTLYIGEGTVRNYVTTLLNKLDLRDRTQLALFYMKGK